ncbi:hypothetical protein BUALT_Bualt02G0153500 [Buddleja alternifolia]|uniref:Uncharacterized protein n=1 Tax=Buddleja alternifolia TaxID=168488 RepID=A0AAV6Y2J5_9LAMI|nr:hypothetical protein BUALT_Bualt02G0153500 [Buddleja alternifolia]
MSETHSAHVQRQLEAPMPWIGIYIAAASLLCTLAMAADAFNGFRTKKFWFPSKFFSLNAASLTFLAIAMKLPIDLTTQMCDVTDRLAKLSSIVFLSTSMLNFMTSLGSMTNKDILMNVVALGVLVITVTANVSIQVFQLHVYLHSRLVFYEEILAICCMLLLLVMFCSSALMISSAKRYMETKYKELHKDHIERSKVVTSDELRVLVEKYWVMAETSSPQFIIARSMTCTASGVVGLLNAIILAEAQIRMATEYMILYRSDSNYGWSTKWILVTQSIGVIVGSIAPVSRWFIAISSSSKRIGSVFTVEAYWTQKMVEWRRSSFCFNIRHLKSRKVVHHLKGLILQLFILAQFLIVLASKLVLLVSVCIASPTVLCFDYVGRSKMKRSISDIGSTDNHRVVSKAITINSKADISHYIMLLDGEVELPTGTLRNICKDVDEVIQRGNTEKPKDLLKLLHKSTNFSGVKEFDNHQVPSLHSHDLPNCWSLPIVTLTSIALALPNVEKQKSDSLMKSVAEGLCYVKLVDKYLDNKGGLANIRSAADVVWLDVEMSQKWQGNDLLEISLKGKSSMEILQGLGDKAEATVLEFTRDARDCLMKNPLNWPANVIAANSMYRISRTILPMAPHEESNKTGEELFEQLSIMIADILAACLTNLARVIPVKCHRIAIEKREKSVRRAALLLGEIEEILELLQQLELPKLLNPDQAAYIEEWRAVIKQNIYKNNHESISTPPEPKNDHVAIEVEE